MSLMHNSQIMQYVIAISHKQHKIIKLYHPEKKFLCQKIIMLKNDDKRSQDRLQAQLQNIKDYLLRFNRLDSQVEIEDHLKIQKNTKQGFEIFYLTLKYHQYPTLSQFLKKQSFGLIDQIPLNQTNRNLFAFFIEELFEIIMRAGGINNYIYSPSNIFLTPKNMQNKFQPIKLFVNPISIIGLKIFGSDQNMDIQDLEEIYPCLPPNLYEFTSMEDLNVLIKKRCFAFLLLCWIIRGVPNLLDSEKLPKSISQKCIKELLPSQSQIYKFLLNAYDDALTKAQKLIGVKLKQLFIAILVQNCKDLSWGKIYERLFPVLSTFTSQKKWVKQTEKNRCQFQQFVQGEWKSQKNKEFYRSRQISPQNKEMGSAMIFLLTKLNIPFHMPLRYFNLIDQLKSQYFSKAQNELVTSLAKISVPQDELMQTTCSSFDINGNKMDQTEIKIPHSFASQNALNIYGKSMIYKSKAKQVLIIPDQNFSIFESSNYW